MYSRWSNVAVVIFWLITMGWLVEDKLLPSLFVGEPPTYRTILADQPSRDGPAIWNVYLNDRLLGRAEAETRTLAGGVAELRSHVRLAKVPLSDVTPGWMQSILRLASGSRDWAEITLTIESDSRLEVDPLGRPLGFHSKTWLSESESWPPSGLSERPAPPGVVPITLPGTVEGQRLKLKVRSGHLIYDTDVYLPPESLMSDALSPQSRLPGVRVGQSWTMPVYSPLRPPTAPIEFLRATVVRREPVSWGQRVTPAYVIEFGPDPGGQLTGNQAARAKAWVDDNGLVLKQEITLFSARLTFERLEPVSPGP